MEENIQNEHKDSSVKPTETENQNCVSEKEKLSVEIERIRKRQKILRILVFVLAFISVSGILFVYWFYKKINEYKPFVETAAEMARQSSEFMEANKIQTQSYSQSLSSPPAYSQPSFSGSSLSMISFGQSAAEAAKDPENRQEMEKVVEEYKETPEMQAMLEEFKKDPELSKIMEGAKGEDPSAMMKKINDPAVMKKVMDKMMKNPQFMMTMMKMASDPRVMNAVKNQKSSVGSQSEKK